MFFKIGLLKNFARLAGKHLCWPLQAFFYRTPTLVASGFSWQQISFFQLNLVFIADSSTSFCSKFLQLHELNLRSIHSLQGNTKKQILAQMFSCEFCEISRNIFFKEPFGRLLHHKHSFCLLSHHDISPFQKQCHTYFLGDYFFGLIYRLGTRVSSIFQARSQKPIFNPVEHLRWRFFWENS